MYLHHTPNIIQKLLPQFIWKKIEHEKVVYLTFDDGPIPDITPWVINELDKYNAKATFFCVGDNIKKHPHIFQKLIQQGHTIGNHTFNHVKGLKSTDVQYLENTKLCATEIEKFNINSSLFRPPHGRLKLSQVDKLKSLGYQIVMWDVLSGDFDHQLSKEKCLKKTLNATRNGSIVVFHDNIKSFDKLQFVLPLYLAALHQQGFSFKTI